MVARETSLIEGLVAAGVDQDSAARAAPDLIRFADLLAEDGVRLGLLGPAERERILARHIIDSAALLPLVGPGPLVDVGSGAGLPGVVLAYLRDEGAILLEASERRCAFLEQVASSDPSIVVVRGRAEEVGRDARWREKAATVVARALAPPPVALELCAPLVAKRGRVVLAAGPSAIGSLEAASATAAELGLGTPVLRRLRVPGATGGGYAIVAVKEEETPQRYPRRTGVPARRPLGGR
ncbi:MAG TPA: 16S rRNA (guanine(527)-N(7))-methyltransferase RsmG [Actinomycetota bacterium]|nr:16S rRNA (guanine(527)-N(7))-methyltransferase RsmG [Actinomycetota bacterium]